MVARNALIHSTHDEALSLLVNTPGAVGAFVSNYPGTNLDDGTWIDNWFRNRSSKHYNNAISVTDEIKIPDTPIPTQNPEPASPIRLQSITAHYFRGFRVLPEPIQMDGDLIVIDGRNTSGKTSLAETLEWLFTGYLSRRENIEFSPHELKNCISNEFRPDTEKTRVSAKFITISEKPETFLISRELEEDYGSTKTSRCKSTLFLNDKKLTDEEERELMEKLFGSVAPILMQHTLRHFVESPPRDRRDYFEKLLHLDQITGLISKAVITDGRLPEFLSPTDSSALKMWLSLGSMIKSAEGKKSHEIIISEENLEQKVIDALCKIAIAEFPDIINETMGAQQIATSLLQEQAKYRQTSFPQLMKIKPKRQIDDEYKNTFALELDKNIGRLREVWLICQQATENAKTIGQDRLIVSKVLQLLLQGKIIDHGKDTQQCPICAYEQIETLTVDRIKEIERWIPAHEAVQDSQKALGEAIKSLLSIISHAIQEYEDFLPTIPSENELEATIDESDNNLLKAIQELRRTRILDEAKLTPFITQAKELMKDTPLPASHEECESFIKKCNELIVGLEFNTTAARNYRDRYHGVEIVVGTAASQDPTYRLRSIWLTCNENRGQIVEDIKWELAKQHAQNDLSDIREALMEFRKQFMESRRISFNSGIGTVWGALRNDRYSSFSQLQIPEPSGKGFPVEIEVKAILDDGTQQIVVDALKVFSESQVNALGIAAFVTRSKLLGHRLLIFDDPVQSMDDEHFKTFAEDVLPHLLKHGFQVLLLTHNDKFARDVSYYHYDHPGYLTMLIRHSRRKGCLVDEGNRRVAERLKHAENKVDEGNLPEAWRWVRLSIERLYTIIYRKYGPNKEFDPESWKNHTIENMWKEGAGDIIEAKIPSAGRRLKDINNMALAGGHDKEARGGTDLQNVIKDLRQLLGELKIGG